MTTAELATRPGSTHPRVSVVPVGDARWRITRRDGEILGYVDHSPEVDGHPFHARRMQVVQRRFIPVGDFWTLQDAIDALS
jgi:hypothetical protein